MKKGRYAKKKRPILFLLPVLLLAAACTWGVSAKYVQQREQDVLVKAKMFYFTSDLLKEVDESYTLNPGTTSVTFTLNNFIDEKRVSDEEIQYTVYINDTKYGETAALNATTKTATISFAVEAGKTYSVRAEGAAGYVKTLSATFTVAPEPEGFYKHLSDEGYYVLLTVWTEDISGNVTVSFPAGLIPDDTDPALAAVTNHTGSGYVESSVTGSFGTYHSHVYRFFKEDPDAGFSLGQFTVTLGSQEAVSGTP